MSKLYLVQPRLRAAPFQRAIQLTHLRLIRGGVPQGDDMAEACLEPAEGKTLRGRLGSGINFPSYF